MVAIILPTVFICLAAFFKAVADTLSFHYSTSVFKWKDRRWWDPSISWQYTGFIRFTKFRPDAWHLANSLMIISFCLAVATAPDFPWWITVTGAGIIYNLIFSLFYDKILLRK